eukprot:TRINITY_DN6657_c0_g1_i1.p1 TRINITY_DN6657_c0_g1~~TRINITY_DN6657_c0_g1_i1.p1  ORF type:complete len:689 (-),score=153.96 TRINITY_DN6657_c0_g1_i1:8-2044(-)
MAAAVASAEAQRALCTGDIVVGQGCPIGELLRLHGWSYHRNAGHLHVRFSGVSLASASAVSALLAALAELIAAELRSRGAEEDALLVRKARIDLSGAELSDAGLHAFLSGWCELGIGPCSMCLMLQRNRLTDVSLRLLGDFAVSEATGTLEELHASHQCGASELTRAAVLEMLQKFAKSSKYPIWVKRARNFRPVHIRLNNCGVLEPESIIEELQASAGALACFADDQGCIRTACVHARTSGRGCPIVHLFDFRSQLRGSEAFTPLSPEKALASTAANGPMQKKGKAFLCGSCDRELPIDMFTRSQFQKAAKLDEEEPEGAAEKAHLVRRCNDCVKQPCCACGVELPLSAFAGTQMLRPHGSRRCRPCAADTWLCVRCGRPKPKTDFSNVEARKGKKFAKICVACSASNPYFDRRHAVCALFSGRFAGPPLWGPPALAREVILRILEFAAERFIKITRTSYECTLCGTTRSFLTSADDAPVERHVRTSKLHERRLQSLEAGNLVEIARAGIDADRFHGGLGVRGAFCGRAQVTEAARLVDARRSEAASRWTWPLLRQALLQQQRNDASRNSDAGCGAVAFWATPEQLAAAEAQLIAEAGEPDDADAPVDMLEGADAGEAWMAARTALQAEAAAARRVQMLCSSAAGRPREDEDEESGSYDVDAAEMAEVQRLLSFGSR